MIYREFFKTLTGFYPHGYQERVEERLRAGDSVILRVPTGTGKTWAAVAPFLYSLASGRRFADRLLYALPLRSLASTLHAGVYAKMASTFGEVSGVANNRQYPGSYYCSLQIGSQKDDFFFQSDLVFTTIDQLLSGYVFLPVSLPDRVGNINAGALIGSLIVLDEIHLLDPSIALGTVIEMLGRLHGLCQFVLMTATATDKAISWLADRLNATSIPVDDDEIRALPSQKMKQRTWRWCSEQITADAIVGQHTGGRTIVLVNSVRKAQDLFLDLKRHYKYAPQKPRLLLLHARFYPDDRKTIEGQIPTAFGPKATQTNTILVTTQVIEAGMDIAADHLYTELAPMNALIQRAGRTARFEDRPLGSVSVYEAAGFGPYREDKLLVDRTRNILQSLPQDGRLVDFVEERVWIEGVHSDVEDKALREYDNLHTRREEVHKAMDQGDRGRLSALVRDIDSVAVAITANPKSLFDGRGWPRLLSVSGFSLMSLGRHFQNVARDRWIAQGAIETETEERPGTKIEWQVLSEKQLRAQWLIAIHPDFASYDPQLGLRLGDTGTEPPVIRDAPPPGQNYSYGFEPWARHCERIIAQAQAMRPFYARAAALLATKYGVSEGRIDELIEISCALHDVGKLSIDWQTRAWLWQQDKDERDRLSGLPVPVRIRVPIAHTSFQAGVDEPFQRQAKYRFPPHAVQGAFATSDALASRLFAEGGENWGQLAAKCVVTAIARHHGPRTRKCTLFRFPPGASRTVAEAIPGGWPGLELAACADPLSRDQFSDVLFTFGRDADEIAWPLYAFLVRCLRLADQAATAGR